MRESTFLYRLLIGGENLNEWIVAHSQGLHKDSDTHCDMDAAFFGRILETKNPIYKQATLLLLLITYPPFYEFVKKEEGDNKRFNLFVKFLDQKFELFIKGRKMEDGSMFDLKSEDGYNESDKRGVGWFIRTVRSFYDLL